MACERHSMVRSGVKKFIINSTEYEIFRAATAGILAFITMIQIYTLDSKKDFLFQHFSYYII